MRLRATGTETCLLAAPEVPARPCQVGPCRSYNISNRHCSRRLTGAHRRIERQREKEGICNQTERIDVQTSSVECCTRRMLECAVIKGVKGGAIKNRGALLLSQARRHTPPPLPLSVHTSGAAPRLQQLRSSAVSQPCNLAVAHCNVTRGCGRHVSRNISGACSRLHTDAEACPQPLPPPSGHPTCLHVPRPSGVARTQ